MALSRIQKIAALGALIVAGGCASDDRHKVSAFSDQPAPSDNTRSYYADPADTFRAVKVTMVGQGFTISYADPQIGLIKGVRAFPDPDDPRISYDIIATADVSGTVPDNRSTLTLAASQRTVLHREWHTWWHLLGVIPLFPTGTDYQTVVTKEGNVTDKSFYSHFFTAVEDSLGARARAETNRSGRADPPPTVLPAPPQERAPATALPTSPQN